MLDVNLNLWAVLAAAAARMALGALWYSKILFGKLWVSLQKRSEEDICKEGSGKAFAGSFVAALIFSAVLAALLDLSGADTAADAAQVGGIVWLGFIATTQSAELFFGGKPLKLFLLDTSFQLVSTVAMSVILALWP